MVKSKLYGKMAVERCRMYLAQLCMAHYLRGEGDTSVCTQKEVVDFLLRELGRDLDVLDDFLDTAEG